MDGRSLPSPDLTDVIIEDPGTLPALQSGTRTQQSGVIGRAHKPLSQECQGFLHTEAEEL